MAQISWLFLVAFSAAAAALPAMAQDVASVSAPPAAEAGADAETEAEPEAEAEAEPEGLRILDARDVRLEDFLWTARLVVVFADTEANPAFQQQMRLIAADTAGLLERDVVVIVDTFPDARSDARQRLRPRGFSLVIVEKDGSVAQRKPSPWSAREIEHAIDRLPLRRQEMLERRPAGR